MLLGTYVFESNASGKLLRVYPMRDMFLVADEAYFGDGGFEDDLECIMEMTKTEPDCHFRFSKRGAIETARFGK